MAFQNTIKKKFLIFIHAIRQAVRNYLRTHRCFRAKMHHGKYTYSVVSACYNVAPYLDEYFRSMTEQRLDFRKHIYLIMVDDGSTDNTAEVIKRWQQKFPRNIKYLYKENGGQAFARNTGFEHVATPWVSFVDSDDFIDIEYFANAEKLLAKYHGDSPETKVKLLIGDMILYHEKNGQYDFRHPIARYLRTLGHLKNAADPGRLLVAATHCMLFDANELRENSIWFPDQRGATGEDGYVIQKYLQAIRQGRIIIAAGKMKYYYRKRKIANSTLDLLPSNKFYYTQQLKHTTLQLLQDAKSQHGYVPIHLQYYVLYDAVWRWRAMENAPRPVFLNAEEVAEYIVRMKSVFSYLNNYIIQTFQKSINNLSYAHRLTFRYFLHGTPQERFVLRVVRYDYLTEILVLAYEYYTDEQPSEEFWVDDTPVVPETAKTSQVSGFEHSLFMHRHIWLRFPVDATLLALRINGLPAQITFTDPDDGPLNNLHIDKLLKRYPRPKIQKPSLQYKGYWLLTDRENEAFDNATALYEFIARTYPEQKMLFALRSSCDDWNLLKKKGVHLLDIDSPEYQRAMEGCSVFISADYGVRHNRWRSFHRCVNLQHGVTKDNLAPWLNRMELDLITAVTGAEYDYFSQDQSPYNLSASQVALTGFSRHDPLLSGDIAAKERVVLIMPTWRQYLVTQNIHERLPAADFAQSTYCTFWKALLNSLCFKKLLDKYSYKALFVPHHCIKNSLHLFEIGDHIEVHPLTNGSIFRALFRRANIFITDYSSAAFELALLDTQTLYFQFDRDEYFAKHSYIKGYFDYERDGFGPVCPTEQDVFDNLEKALEKDGVPDDVYLQRMRSTMTLRDGKCCERTYQAIKNLEQGVVHKEFI